jgi:glycosyltransferase involved in cell wall biosynthesis
MNRSPTSPRVSVVIPTYNRRDLLERAIASVRAQTMSDFEIIVVDDHSTDSTLDLLAGLVVEEPRLRWLRNDRSQGPAGARNAGIARAEADIVAFLDSDDRWLPHKLEVSLEVFATRQSTGFLATDYWRMGELPMPELGTAYMLRHLDRWTTLSVYAREVDRLQLTRRPSDIERFDVLLFALIAGCAWPHTSSVLVRRRLVETVGGFPEQLQRCEDLDLWLRLAERGGLLTLAEPLAEYYADGVASKQGARYAADDEQRYGDLTRENSDHIAFIRRLALGRNLPPGLWACWHRRLCGLHRQIARQSLRRQPLLGVAHVAQAIRHRPKDLLFLAARPRRYLGG